MNNPKITAMYVIKNEERWIEKSLRSTSEVCNEIVILDNGSTDNTVKICKSFSNVMDIQINPKPHLPFDETKGKNTVLQMALKRNPDFILYLDGDEVFQPNAKKILFKELTTIHPNSYVFEFQVLHMWDRKNMYRYDGTYGNFWGKRLLRMAGQPRNLSYPETFFPGNRHCPPLPKKCIWLGQSCEE